MGVAVTSCIQRRRKRKRELKAAKELAEMEGVEMEGSSSNMDDSKGDTDDNATKDPDAKKKKKKDKKKDTKTKRKEALDKKAKEAQSKNDPTVVADFSDDNKEDPDGSQRDMLGNNATVRGEEDSGRKGAVGDNRFDANNDGADNLPAGDEEGGGFF